MTTLYGIKNCDTVRKAQQYLNRKNISFHFHDFRIDGLDEKAVNTFISACGIDKIINKRSTTWKQLSEEQKNSLDETTAIRLCIENPTLIKRPVLEKDGEYFIGFKSTDYDNIFN